MFQSKAKKRLQWLELLPLDLQRLFYTTYLDPALNPIWKQLSPLHKYISDDNDVARSEALLEAAKTVVRNDYLKLLPWIKECKFIAVRKTEILHHACECGSIRSVQWLIRHSVVAIDEELCS